MLAELATAAQNAPAIPTQEPDKKALRKQKNKESATRSRDRRKRKFQLLETRATDLETENEKLRATVRALEWKLQEERVSRGFSGRAGCATALTLKLPAAATTTSADTPAAAPTTAPSPFSGPRSARSFSDSA
jgi:hypothetical protein